MFSQPHGRKALGCDGKDFVDGGHDEHEILFFRG